MIVHLSSYLHHVHWHFSSPLSHLHPLLLSIHSLVVGDGQILIPLLLQIFLPLLLHLSHLRLHRVRPVFSHIFHHLLPCTTRPYFSQSITSVASLEILRELPIINESLRN